MISQAPRKCPVCGVDVCVKRSTTRYCSRACRMHSYYVRNREARLRRIRTYRAVRKLTN